MCVCVINARKAGRKNRLCTENALRTFLTKSRRASGVVVITKGQKYAVLDCFLILSTFFFIPFLFWPDHCCYYYKYYLFVYVYFVSVCVNGECVLAIKVFRSFSSMDIGRRLNRLEQQKIKRKRKNRCAKHISTRELMDLMLADKLNETSADTAGEGRSLYGCESEEEKQMMFAF